MRRLEEIRDIIRQWTENIAIPSIAIRREVTAGKKVMGDIVILVSQGKGKKYFDEFREKIAGFKQNEENFISKRRKLAEDKAGDTRIVIVAGTTGTSLVALILSFFWRVP